MISLVSFIHAARVNEVGRRCREAGGREPPEGALKEGAIVGTATRKLSDGAKIKGWLVRNEQGETFGPVDFETLKAWACDGRLSPTNEVSENGVDWLVATVSRPLEMNWVAEVTPGTFYGPIHKRAMEELVRDGSIAGSSAFFVRCGLDEKTELPPDDSQAERIRLLTEQCAQAQQQAAEFEGALRAARGKVSDFEGQLHEARRQTAEREGSVREAQCLAAESESKVRQVQREAELAHQQVEAGERRLQAQLAERDELMQRRVAAFEEQVRLAQQQVGAYAEQVEQVREQAAAVEAHLRATVQQLSEQAEQARSAQQQWVLKAEGLAEELETVRKAHAEWVTKAAELRAEQAAEEAARDARERAREAERHELGAALAQAQAEMAAQKARLTQLQNERQVAESAVVGRGELEVRLQTLSAELAGVEQALSCEKEAARQAEARCAALDVALQEAKARRSDSAAVSDGMSGELRQMRQQIESLCALFQQAQEARETAARMDAARPAAAPVERVYVEVEPVDVLPPENRQVKVPPAKPEPSRVAPEAQKRPDEQPQKASNPGRTGSGISMADLEQQARRELERLGAQGANLFRKKK
jgi:chromosome segregation ATPase